LGQIMRAIFLALALASPALADPIQGLDDPAFRAPFDRALQGDDPTAWNDLHTAAEAGNQAAILALPVVGLWLRRTKSLAQRKALSAVNGLPMHEAFSAADPAAALWNTGEIGRESDIVLARAFGLYDLEEPEKASVLFMIWVNQTGGYGPLPDGFFDHPTPPVIMAQVLWAQLRDINFTPPAEADALVVQRLKVDDPAAWIALAGYAGLYRVNDPEPNLAPPPDAARLAAIFKAAGVAPDHAARRMAEATPLLMSHFRDGQPLDLVTAKAATAAFRTEPEFQPLLSVCATACPKTADQCAIAFVAAFGHPFVRTTLDQPLTSLISTEDFFATPRGRLLLLRSTESKLGEDPATSHILKAARDIDACLADAVLAALP
jgi:hypothetical protein